MNIIGERQHYEKYLPKVINYVLDGKVLPIHGTPDKKNAGLRHYLHARTIADEILYIVQNTTETLHPLDASKGVFNIVGEREIDNLAFAQMIAKFVGKELKYEIVDFHSSRPGHDLRYALDGSKAISIGFKSKVNFEDSVKKIVEWSLQPENLKWLGRTKI
jgi:dTDP-glucose 4,6-dehydratase